VFDLYFGAFDIVLYLGGTYAAIALAKAICDQLDATDEVQSTTTTAPTVAPTMAPMQPIPPHLTAPVPKREEVTVRVSLG
jgi:hypothetical protein